VTHVDERANKAGETGQGSTPERQLWTAGNGRGRRKTVTYADAGVSIHAGEQAVELLRERAARAPAKRTAKKSTAKKAPAKKKATAKKSAAKKSTAKKATAKKASATRTTRKAATPPAPGS